MFDNKLDFKQTFERRLSEKYGREVSDSHFTERFDILGEMVRDYAGYDWRSSWHKISWTVRGTYEDAGQRTGTES